MKSAHSDVAFSVPVPSITERKRDNSDAVLELSEAQGLVILNLTYSCIKCDKRVPSVGHDNKVSVFASGPFACFRTVVPDSPAHTCSPSLRHRAF